MKRALLLLALVGCTPAQATAWVAWHDADPDAAVAFLDTDTGRGLLADDGSDGPQFADYLEAGSRYGSAVWEHIARCESGGNWTLRATNRTGSYGGGLMIRDNVWRSYGGTQFAPTADRASKSEQITVAERIADDVGLDSAWQCWP